MSDTRPRSPGAVFLALRHPVGCTSNAVFVLLFHDGKWRRRKPAPHLHAVVDLKNRWKTFVLFAPFPLVTSEQVVIFQRKRLSQRQSRGFQSFSSKSFICQSTFLEIAYQSCTGSESEQFYLETTKKMLLQLKTCLALHKTKTLRFHQNLTNNFYSFRTIHLVISFSS